MKQLEPERLLISDIYHSTGREGHSGGNLPTYPIFLSTIMIISTLPESFREIMQKTLTSDNCLGGLQFRQSKYNSATVTFSTRKNDKGDNLQTP